MGNRTETIAFPSFSTGVYRYPTEQASAIALSEIKKFLRDNLTIEHVLIVSSHCCLPCFQLSCGSVWIKTRIIYICIYGMPGLNLEVTKPMIWGITFPGGIMLFIVQMLITKWTINRTSNSR